MKGGGVEDIIIPELDVVMEEMEKRHTPWDSMKDVGGGKFMTHENILIYMLGKGATHRYIAEYLDRSVGSVSNKAQNLGL